MYFYCHPNLFLPLDSMISCLLGLLWLLYLVLYRRMTSLLGRKVHCVLDQDVLLATLELKNLDLWDLVWDTDYRKDHRILKRGANGAQLGQKDVGLSGGE